LSFFGRAKLCDLPGADVVVVVVVVSGADVVVVVVVSGADVVVVVVVSGAGVVVVVVVSGTYVAQYKIFFQNKYTSIGTS
jgi:hypothetical protein